MVKGRRRIVNKSCPRIQARRENASQSAYKKHPEQSECF
ncbi:hypothetical protein CHK_2779 [Christensenella hongkongensis]|uniref:Uncharacterized protein n=1 Tax=Christensenella hongkongensis TaxID=270498 RepID=A0A0M2NBY0_9FIRM|nr:hypothetical protein CHK_2779 [Christensenella hongkongensis]